MGWWAVQEGEEMTVRILRGDCLDRLRELPDESVHCCVTSPPYYGLRSYIPDGHDLKKFEIGLEPTLAEYLDNMVAVFREVRRVLRSDGTLWLNIGDSYATGTAGDRKPTATGKHGYWENPNVNKRVHGGDAGLKPKDLMGVPWRLAFALQADGWYLRQDIIWHKPNPMPESVRDRCTKSHEYIFLMAKSERYFYDFDAVQEPSSDGTHARLPGNVRPAKGQAAYEAGDDLQRTKAGLHAYAEKQRAAYRDVGVGSGARPRKGAPNGSGTKNNPSFDEAMAVMPPTRNPRSVWTITTEACKEAHFATFPTEIPRRAIVAGCPGRVCAKCGEPITGVGTNAEHGMRDVREGVQFSEVRHGANEVLQSDMLQRGETKECSDSDMCDVRQDIQAGPAKPHGAVLQQGMCVSAHGKNTVHDEGVLQDQQGLHPGVSAGSPERIDAGLCDAASSCDGGCTGATPAAERSGASQERGEGRQPAVELGTANKNGPRQASETSDQANSLPALQRTDRVVWSCHKCQADLSAPGAIGAGVVLDCFLGSGTTAIVADRLQRDCIGIELNAEYADMAERRIKGDSPLFAEVSA